MPMEWVYGKVSTSDKNKLVQQASLRKKLNVHSNSLSHKAAAVAVKTKDSKLLAGGFAAQATEGHLETCNVFRTAYYGAKNDRPYSDHPALIELQELNGLNSGRVLHSNVICADIIDHISSEMRKNIVKHILHARPKISVLN
jgi:hypothetical protein